MKRCIKGSIAFLCAALFVFSLFGDTRAKDFDVELTINGKGINFTEETGRPFANETARTFVPLRITMESLGVNVEWDGDAKAATLTDGETTVVVTVGSKIIVVNGENIENDVAAIVSNGRIYLPIRAVAEAFGANVEWNKSANTVEIESDKFVNVVEVIVDKIAEGLEAIFPYTNAYVSGDAVRVRSEMDTSSDANIVRRTKALEKINVVKVIKVKDRLIWCQLDSLEDGNFIAGEYVEIENWDDIEVEELPSENDPASGIIQKPYDAKDRISKDKGAIINYDERRETYYDLKMEVCYNRLWNLKDEEGNLLYPKEEYPASVDEMGFKRFGPYAVVATNWDINPLGTLVNTSAGTAIVADTGAFKATFPTAIDIATNWTRGNWSALD